MIVDEVRAPTPTRDADLIHPCAAPDTRLVRVLLVVPPAAPARRGAAPTGRRDGH